MRLSDERIQFIASQISDILLDKNLVTVKGLRNTLKILVARAIIKDLQIEDQIDEEVKNIIASMKRDIPEGSSEWKSIFQQQKEAIAKRLNYIL